MRGAAFNAAGVRVAGCAAPAAIAQRTAAGAASAAGGMAGKAGDAAAAFGFLPLFFFREGAIGEASG